MSKCDTLKAQNHLLDVTIVGKPWGNVQVLISNAQCAKNVSQLEPTWGQNDSNFRLCSLGEN